MLCNDKTFLLVNSNIFNSIEQVSLCMSNNTSMYSIKEKKILDNYTPKLNDIVIDTIYISNTDILNQYFYRVISIITLSDSIRLTDDVVLKLQYIEQQEVCLDVDLSLISDILKHKTTLLHSKFISETYDKTLHSGKVIPVDIHVSNGCLCLDKKDDIDNHSTKTNYDHFNMGSDHHIKSKEISDQKTLFKEHGKCHNNEGNNKEQTWEGIKIIN